MRGDATQSGKVWIFRGQKSGKSLTGYSSPEDRDFGHTSLGQLWCAAPVSVHRGIGVFDSEEISIVPTLAASWPYLNRLLFLALLPYSHFITPAAILRLKTFLFYLIPSRLAIRRETYRTFVVDSEQTPYCFVATKL